MTKQAADRAIHLIDLLDRVSRELTTLGSELDAANETLETCRQVDHDLVTFGKHHDLFALSNTARRQFDFALTDNREREDAAKATLARFNVDNDARLALVKLSDDLRAQLRQNADALHAPDPTYTTDIGQKLAQENVAARHTFKTDVDQTHIPDANPYATVYRKNRRFYLSHRGETLTFSPHIETLIRTCVKRGIFLEPTTKNLARVSAHKPTNEAEAVWCKQMRQLRASDAGYPEEALRLTSGVYEKAWYITRNGKIESKHETLADAVLSLVERNITNIVWSPTFHRQVSSVLFDHETDPDDSRAIRAWQNVLHERHGQRK